MAGVLDENRWLKVLFSITAIPAGLLLTWGGWVWATSSTKRTLELPDTGGHWGEFTVIILVGVTILAAGVGILAMGIGALSVTKGFENWNNELLCKSRNIGLTTGAVGGLLVIACLLFLVADKPHSGVELVKQYQRGKRDFNGVYMRGADLSGADLNGANLYRANVSEANLQGANLSGANLSQADLSGTNLRNASVTEEQLAQARSLKGATMPDGSKHE